MAQLAVAGAGAAVGFVLGGPVGAQIGWALGGVAGALLFPPKGQDTQGPRLNDLTVQTSGYGLPIPLAVGRVKLAGNVIWKADLRERATTRRQTEVFVRVHQMSGLVGRGLPAEATL